ncbi:MAG: glycosyltransferase [Actinomycetota bacterium]
MRILLWHGYLLRGSGSNVYTANLARTWRRAGHDVLLLCQERDIEDLDFVDLHGDLALGNRRLDLHAGGAPAAPGRCRLARPDIGGLLPLYVYDDYPGYIAKRFVDLDDHELARYVAANVTAMATAIEEHDPDAIVTGHEVMGPYIALEACRAGGRPYLAKLHGSGLEYAVKLQERYRHYARLGLGGARVVVGGSRYILDEAARWVAGFETRAEVVNPGCDVELFAPRDRDRSQPPTVGYVGKLMASKGVHHLIAALGLTRTQGLRAVVVGFGDLHVRLEAIAAALQRGDLDAARLLAGEGDEAGFDTLTRFFSEIADERYRQRVGEVPVRFTGRLEHGPLAEVLPGFDVLVVPSIVPEAFGMVAAEAAAAGVLPIVADHSGLAEAAAAIERALGAPGLLRFDPEDPIAGIATAVDRVLGLPEGERRAMGLAAAELARARWSWEHVAARILALAGPAAPPR